MDPKTAQRVRELFEQALHLPADERLAWLDSQLLDDDGEGDGDAGDGAAIRAEVRTLLESHEDAGDFLGEPPAPQPPLEHAPGTRIGRYTLVRRIGEGGFSDVYLAEQSFPIRRTVALKLIKPGMDSRHILARFNAERNALAMLDHPGIARIIDAGATGAGRPYFVMELVDGAAVTAYCREHGLRLPAVIELFLAICDAVGHAHQKGIIHRDLKPTNVLATRGSGAADDDKPHVKVIDFGIAKMLHADPTGDGATSFMTTHHRWVGTPAYMSPEQLGGGTGSGADGGIDTRSDVYSLGIMLYELLAGRPPFDPKDLASSGMDKGARLICETDPAPPSTVVTSPELRRQVGGDLDSIVMRCLEKDRARRYESVGALAADVRRYRDHEPISARPRTALYRLRKLVRRNPLASGLIVFLILVLVLSAVISTAQAIRAGRAELSAVAARRVAERHADQLRRTLYAAQMNQAGYAAAAIGGLEHVRELLAPWSRRDDGNGDGDGADLRGWEWYYLDGLTRRERLRLRGHNGAVFWVAWSPDGTRLASAGADNTVRIWRRADGRELRMIPGTPNPFGPNSRMTCAAWSPDGTRLVCVSWGETFVFDLAADQAVCRMVLAYNGDAPTAAWRPDGARFAVNGPYETVLIFEPGSTTPLRELRGPTNQIFALAWSPDGRRVASGGRDGAHIWDAESGRLLATFTFTDLAKRSALPAAARAAAPVAATAPVGGEFRGIQWSPDARRLLLSGNSSRLWVMEVRDADGGEDLAGLATRAPLTNLSGHLSGTIATAWSPDGARIASGAVNDMTVRVWDAQSLEQIGLMRGNSGGVICVQWSPDGAELAAASAAGDIKIWSATDSGENVTMRGHIDDVRSVAWHPDGTRIISASGDATLRIWDAATGRELRTMRGHRGRTWCAAWSPDGTRIASSGEDGTLRTWSAEGDGPLMTMEGHKSRVTSVSWSIDGKRLASSAYERSIRVWDAQSGTELRNISQHAQMVAWSPRAPARFAAGGFFHTTVFDADTGARSFDVPPGMVAWSPDGARLAVTGEHGGAIAVWDVAARAKIIDLRGHTGVVEFLAWSPDGARLASGSRDFSVKIWNPTDGSQLLTLPAMNVIRALAWSPEGNRLAAGGHEGIIAVYDAAPGDATTNIATSKPLQER